MMRARRALGCVAAAAAVLCGCLQDHVTVTIEPRADGSFVRTLRMWDTSANEKDQILPPTAELVDRAKPHYPKTHDTKDASVAFQAAFRTVPPDMQAGNDSNRGGYTVWTSPLGQLGYYRERRPGRTDHFARFREAADAADLAMSYLTALARQQLQGEQGLDRLVEFIDGPLRKDFKDALYFVDHATLCASATFAGKEPEKTLASMAAFLAQFAEERDYLQTEEVVRFRTEEGIVELVTAFVARKMGRPLDAMLRKKLAALADPERGAEAHRAAVESLKMTDNDFEQAMKPITEGVLHIGSGADPELRYVLILPPEAELRHTSGRPDEKKRRIEWEDTLDDRPVMGLYFALWTIPNADWQTKHLGRVAVRGEKLQDAILWDNSLAPERAAAWRAALERLDPKADLPKQLSAIRLGPEGERKAPEEGADTITEALKEPPP